MTNEAPRKLYFASDYMEGAHPSVLARLVETNMYHEPGYGDDSLSEAARTRIRDACDAPEADVFFLVGGTQTNACVIDALLAPYQGVVAAATGHVSTHEAGAIERGGHKVIEIAHDQGKLSVDSVRACFEAWESDGNRFHMVMPGAVYISQPTEYGTLYSLSELEAIAAACHDHGAALYVDGARLAYALACLENDVELVDLARLADAFYIGGTKCGALLGEAVVFPRHNRVPHFFTTTKQHGALLAKGRVCGAQFDALFADRLYWEIGRVAIEMADRIRAALIDRGYELALDAPTNQVFVVLDDAQLAALSQRVEMGFWEHTPDGRTVMRLATSWATDPTDVDALIEVL